MNNPNDTICSRALCSNTATLILKRSGEVLGTISHSFPICDRCLPVYVSALEDIVYHRPI